jgi:hypothetical protein
VARTHGGLRGLSLSRNSLLFEGPFGRIFRALPPADFGETDEKSEEALKELAKLMISDPDSPKDGPDQEESGIPSAYTYFGQFIDHDLTFDPASSLQKQKDPDALADYRTPAFDLDNVYGRGPDDQPYMYTRDGKRFVLGNALTGAPQVNKDARDLHRNSGDPDDDKAPARALIGDPRNDENVIVAQLQGLMHRLHNQVAADNPRWSFPQIQQAVRFHYQWVLVHDFLPTVIDGRVLDEILPGSSQQKPDVSAIRLRFFHHRDFGFMPLEFSAAAYRFGHSMVRPGYRLNDGSPDPSKDTLLPIFNHDKDARDLRGFKSPQPDWAIDWRRFIDLAPMAYGGPIDNLDPKNPGNRERLQLAYKIDTSLVNPLGNLPDSIASNPNVLAERNLLRGWRMRLPSGEDVARAMGVPIKNVQIGKFTGDPKDIKLTNGDFRKFHNGVFDGNTPLWTYCLAETVASDVTVRTTEGDKKIATRKLGQVGGRIVAETFLGLLLADSKSYLNLDPLWKPHTNYVQKGLFGLRELVAASLEFNVS